MKEREFRRERTTGLIDAVELVDGVVDGCCGPLDPEAAEAEFLPAFDYDRDRREWLGRHRDEFELHDTALPYPDLR